MSRSRPASAAPASGDVPVGLMGSWTHDLRTGRVEWSEGTEELFGLGQLAKAADPKTKTFAPPLLGENGGD